YVVLCMTLLMDLFILTVSAYTGSKDLTLHDALPISLAKTDAKYMYVFAHGAGAGMHHPFMRRAAEALEARGISAHRFDFPYMQRSEEHTSELQSRGHLVCRLLLEKNNK